MPGGGGSPGAALKPLGRNKNLTVPAFGPRQPCGGAAVAGHQRPTGWPLPQEAPSRLTGATNDQPPRFCHACKHIFWSTGLLCTTPSPGQVTGHHCFTSGKGCPDAGKAGGLLQTHLPMPTHPKKPLIPATDPQEPKIPFPSAIFVCPGLAVLLGDTSCCPTPG